jgi:hypothetical protein
MGRRKACQYGTKPRRNLEAISAFKDSLEFYEALVR